ncbi:MAG: hypothetical protein KC636_20075 [Myxococcales bacterium]|nr:hypothetical protein [Myxococcales bacterium]
MALILASLASLAPAVARAAAPSCPTTDGAVLIPADAQTAVAVTLGSLTRTTPWRDYEAALTRDANARQTLDALSRCNVELAAIDEVWMGYGESAGADDSFVVVARGPGLGEEATLRCLAGALRSVGGVAPTLTRERCANAMTLRGDTTILGLDADHLAVVSKRWKAEVVRRAATRPRTSKVASLALQRGAHRHLRVAALVDASMQRELSGLGAELRALSGSFEFGARVRGELVLTAASAADASALQTTLVGYLGLARGMAGSAGLPPAIFDDVSIRERGADVSVALDLSYQDLRAAAAIP